MSAQVRTLIFVWLALMGLLALTVGASFLPLGSLKPVVNIGIAFLKAALIFWVYMHLRELSGLIRLTVITGVVTIAILIGLMSSDYLTRFWFKIPT